MSTVSNEVFAYLTSLQNNPLEMSREIGRNLRVVTGVGNSSQTTEEECMNDQMTTISESFSELNEVQFEEHFVEDVRSYRCLWDTTSRSFKDTHMKAKAWDTLAGRYGKSGRNFLTFVKYNEL